MIHSQLVPEVGAGHADGAEREVEHSRTAVDHDQPEGCECVQRPYAEAEKRKADYLFHAGAPSARAAESLPDDAEPRRTVGTTRTAWAATEQRTIT